MDYEKKYKEALELMKDCIPDEDGLVHIRPCEIFTELADSEDEKIRKALVDYFTAYKEQKECGIKTFYGIPTDSIIAWLEKQGEQKPAWSKLDEALLKLSLENLTELKDRYGKGYGRVGDCIVWLKNLKNRVGSEANCTTTTEWSKEDNDMMKAIIEDVHCGADFSADVMREANEKEDWLKSIRRRYISLKNTCNWEPTEEKMEALKAATYCKDQAISKVLFELYQDLEKVKKVRHEG